MMRKHFGSALTIAAAAALAAAFALLWAPSLPGRVTVGAVLAWWLAHLLRAHKLARKADAALVLGTALAVALIIWLPVAVPPLAFVLVIAPTALHYANPKRVTVARTTRGVRTTAGKAAGGRAGRPGEKPHAPRSRPASSRTPAQNRPKTATAAQNRPPASTPPAWEPDGWRRPTVPEPELAWPYKARLSRVDLLPWAGEGAPAGPAAEPEIPKRLRRRPDRPSGVHRVLCGDCAAGACDPGPCRAKGCECAADVHDIPPF